MAYSSKTPYGGVESSRKERGRLKKKGKKGSERPLISMEKEKENSKNLENGEGGP